MQNRESWGSYQQGPAAINVAQSQRDVDKHDDVADQDSGDITAALTVDLVLNAALRAEWDGQVGVFIVLYKVDKPVEVQIILLLNIL